MDEIIDKAQAAGVGAGIHAGFNELLHVQQENRWMQRGANLVVHGADIQAFQQTMQRDIAELRLRAGRATAKDKTSLNI